jgi:hypothetical protein
VRLYSEVVATCFYISYSSEGLQGFWGKFQKSERLIPTEKNKILELSDGIYPFALADNLQ